MRDNGRRRSARKPATHLSTGVLRVARQHRALPHKKCAWQHALFKRSKKFHRRRAIHVRQLRRHLVRGAKHDEVRTIGIGARTVLRLYLLALGVMYILVHAVDDDVALRQPSLVIVFRRKRRFLLKGRQRFLRRSVVISKRDQ